MISVDRLLVMKLQYINCPDTSLSETEVRQEGSATGLCHGALPRGSATGLCGNAMPQGSACNSKTFIYVEILYNKCTIAINTVKISPLPTHKSIQISIELKHNCKWLVAKDKIPADIDRILYWILQKDKKKHSNTDIPTNRYPLILINSQIPDMSITLLNH